MIELFEKILREGSRDEYNMMQRQHNRDNMQILRVGELDDYMNSVGGQDYGFIKGFWKWSEECHNWGVMIDDDVFVVVSFAIDDTTASIEIVSCFGKNREILDSARCPMNYDKVISLCKEISEKYDEYEIFN